MAGKIVNELPVADKPLLSTDKILVSRDGITTKQTTVNELPVTKAGTDLATNSIDLSVDLSRLRRDIVYESRALGSIEDDYSILINDSAENYILTIVSSEQLNYVEFFQDNAGILTLSAASGVIINGGVLSTNGIGSKLILEREVASNSYYARIVYPQNQPILWSGRTSTVGTATMRITTDSVASSSTSQLTLVNNSAVSYEGNIIARDIVNGNSKHWKIAGLIKRGSTASTTTLVGSQSIVSSFADTGASAWTISLSADTTIGALAISATGSGTNTIRWTAHIFYSVGA